MINSELLQKVEAHFKERFSGKPMHIFAPGRINLIGEHTDYNDGFVFPAAIDKGIIAALAKSSSETCTVFAVDANNSLSFSLDKVAPIENGTWRNYVLGVVSEIQKKGIQLTPFNIAFAGDIPSGSGMSSSAALENSIVFGLNELFKLGLSKKEMIYISQMAEHNFVGVKCGIMDQYASMFGQVNSAILLDCRSLDSKTFQLDFNDYELMLINTNVKHSLSDSAYNDRRKVCEKVSKLLDVKALRDVNEQDLKLIKNQISLESYQKALYVVQENARVIEASKAIVINDMQSFGDLMYASHKGLSEQYKVSCDELDFLVDATKDNANILGARMMGGGFGGCTINLIKKTETESFKKYITKFYLQKFKKNCSIYTAHLSDGTQLIEN